MKIGRRSEKPGPEELWKCRGCGKRGKPKAGFPTLSTSPLEISPKGGEIPTFPQLGRSGLGKWKTKGRFPTFPDRFATTTPASPLKTRKPKNGWLGGLAPAIAAAALRATSRVIVVDREK